MSESNFVLMVGLPGSTKSTYVKELAKEGYTVHASDIIRAELGDENDQSRNGEVFEILNRRVRNDLMAGKNVCLDATNLRRKNRMHLLRMLKGIKCHKKCVVMCVPFEECITNNANRERQVPEGAMWKMHKNWQMPCKQEGWDEIELVYPKPEYECYYGDPIHYVEMLADYDQGNSHHAPTLGQHMAYACNVYLKENNLYYDEAALATFLHDVGKPLTRSDKNGRGEVDGEAHYLNHHSAGSYYSLFFWTHDFIDKKYVALLVELHMRPHLEWRHSTQALEKDINLFGNRVVEDVYKIHYCDLSATGLSD